MNKIDRIIELIGQLKIADLPELAKALETSFGMVTNVACIPTCFPVEQKIEVHLIHVDHRYYINTIKVVKTETGLGLTEVKKLVDTCPCLIKTFDTQAAAERFKIELESFGAIVKLK